jgi:AcrR family transcriptional regulator
VALRAGASLPAIYEVFGDKAGLIREVFFYGFGMLGDELAATPTTQDPLQDILDVARAFRRFVVANPVLAQVMFSQPFADFDPTAQENEAGRRVSDVFVERVRTAVETGLLAGDPVDVAQVLFAFVEGLAAAESAQRFGRSKKEVDRRWRLGLDALLGGLRAEA